jgi:hypothetical protein
MRESLAPLDCEPVSVHAPFVSYSHYSHVQYRHEPTEQRKAAVLGALHGVALGAYDQRIVCWLAGWDVPVVAAVVSLLWRARHAASQESRRDGGQPR